MSSEWSIRSKTYMPARCAHRASVSVSITSFGDCCGFCFVCLVSGYDLDDSVIQSLFNVLQSVIGCRRAKKKYAIQPTRLQVLKFKLHEEVVVTFCHAVTRTHHQLASSQWPLVLLVSIINCHYKF
jgi:hypothetical protein